MAQQLGVSPSTVRRLARRGELPKIIIGGATRFKVEDVEALVDRGEDRAAGHA